MTDRVLITFHLSPAERDLLDARAGAGHRSEYLRRLILADAQQAGLDLPAEVLAPRGKYIRKEKS